MIYRRNQNKLSIKAASQFINDIVLSINTNYLMKNHPMWLKRDAPVGVGNTLSSDIEVFDVWVGAQELYENNSNGIVSDYDFMSCLASVYHEEQHVRQMYESMYQQNKLSEIVTVSHFATIQNHAYYQNMNNYLINPREIDANIAGAMGAYKTCERKFGHERAEELLCTYVNETIARTKDNWFIHALPRGRKYQNSDEIFQAMGDALERSVHTPRYYDFEKANMDLANNQVAYALREKPDAQKLFNRLPDGFVQDCVAASFYFSQPNKKFLPAHCTAISNTEFDRHKLL